MEPESNDVIDVDAEQIDCPVCESIDWYSATDVQRILHLNKAGLQNAIAKLRDIYGIELKILRRGSARATEYSRFALDAIPLLHSQKFTELRNLVEQASVAPPVSSPTAIVFVGKHNQIASTAATVADSNLAQIASLKSGLLSNYRELGRSLGRQAAAEVRQGFTDEVRAGLANLQDS
ncbi:hypothetical protein [Microcoleus sp. CAWBG58]|uniref:hypothetical protein n=1 Tax=Microcoleus sp. CAWBG58 TaxID=2841651 RepID=UPI0025F83A73|nr:hypothetical protein [Microcoleus sp. CAWBG58]